MSDRGRTAADLGPPMATWLRDQLAEDASVRIEGLEQVEVGHSAQMLTLTMITTIAGREHARDLVVRLRPPPPGLLEPYDLRRQFDVLRALEPTPVRAPRALWIDETGDVLGRPFYVMERLPGQVYERTLPAELRAAPERLARMSERIVDQIAAIHLVDLEVAGLAALGGGADHLTHELAHWRGETERVRRGPLPALDRLAQELQAAQPAASPRVTLVHGDTKPGNFAFVDDQVSAVFDWEMAAVGDPMTDLGWAEVAWQITPAFAGLPPGHFDRLLDRYRELTGIAVHDRAWYRAFGAYKMAVILLLGSMLVDAGHTDDPRYAEMGMGCPHITTIGLTALGVTERLDPGPVLPRDDRLAAIGAAPAAR